ncbi:hypothetical protein; putative exported protein [Cupriavidus metallidurans CH34]|uniref:Uncharacterized protein n=1 Tax=Cupriavidus metallidurans (strain ATCC 43123 / DSM 2839 / NBRC 102507 / CH34) TaxID=266264 RepID=D3DXS0_CUPMC|nr:hypothetical protein; putative exported protein [Cupriavidus metallidurans CH34]
MLTPAARASGAAGEGLATGSALAGLSETGLRAMKSSLLGCDFGSLGARIWAIYATVYRQFEEKSAAITCCRAVAPRTRRFAEPI